MKSIHFMLYKLVISRSSSWCIVVQDVACSNQCWFPEVECLCGPSCSRFRSMCTCITCVLL